MNFSVLMSIYYKEKADYLESCLESLANQTQKATEWVIVQDGPIGKDLQMVIDKYKSLGNNIIDVKLEKNQGLGLALREGIMHCNYEIVARMDTDDIARKDRFEIQLKFLLENNLDVCSSHIKEFEEDPSKIIAERKVPLSHNEIIKYQKKRSAFNHMAVMFKKESVLSAGNYKHCPLMEDDMLWVDMILNGAICGNINDYLVFARTNQAMIVRRGGFSYFKKYRKARKQIYKTGYISYFQYFKTNFIQFFICIMPGFMRKLIFFKFLHKKK
ncbi:MAG: glycosyltransferase [Anaeroplasmataceae bacterium]|nr:glycosyltransferase [Anaeroplasmataceae bacterium]